MPALELPAQALVVWPVGNGDSFSLKLSDELFVQVDLNHLADAVDDEDPRSPVIDRLCELLPEGSDGKPYLAAFILTHPDQDHCRGFRDLRERVTIGELWLTPRTFRDYRDRMGELSEDGEAVAQEAHRRVKVAKRDGMSTASGHRIRIIGSDELLNEEEYEGLPREFLSTPRDQVSRVDGHDLAGSFTAFIHAPFKDDAAGDERNETSLAMQATLSAQDCVQRILLMGDLGAPTIKKIIEVSEANNNGDKLDWDVLVAPHHCSHHAMYSCDNGEHTLEESVLDGLDAHALSDAKIVASCRAFNEAEEGPPHQDAREHYEDIVGADAFIATCEQAPEPIVFGVGGGECGYRSGASQSEAAAWGATAQQLTGRRSSVPTRSHEYGQCR